jgi:LmeA-like phospholipid-binding
MSRRRSGCLVALLVLLLLVVGVLVVVDRVGVGIAERRVADQIATRGDLTSAPDVKITGFPFLTQAVSGTYQDIRVHLTAEELSQPAGTRADVSLHGVHVPLSDVLSGSVKQIPVDRVDGTATLSYALLADQLGGNTTLTGEGDGIRLTKSVKVLGIAFDVTATGTVTLHGQDIVVDVQKASAGDAHVPDSVLGQVTQLLDFSYRVPELPFGLQLTSVRPAPEGLDVAVQASDTVLSG